MRKRYFFLYDTMVKFHVLSFQKVGKFQNLYWLQYQKSQWNFIMFKFSAVSQIWKKYIQKLNDWDLPLTHSLGTLHTCNLPNFSVSEVLDNHKLVITSFGLEKSDNELDLPYIILDSKDLKISTQTQIHCRLIKVFHQTSIHSSHKTAYTY